MTDFVNLTNLLLVRMNEVTLETSGDGFDTVRGVQLLAKNAINNSIRIILQETQEWPFLKTTYTQTLTGGSREYSYPSDFSSVDDGSFYLKKTSGIDNQPRKLRVIGYEEYLQSYRDSDENGKTGAPEVIYQTYENKFGVSPTPDAAYEIEYVYWKYPDPLTIHDDLCIIPQRFDHTIVDGGMMFMMRFRSNDQSAAMHQSAFEAGIKAMRRVLLDDPTTLRSTVIAGRG